MKTQVDVRIEQVNRRIEDVAHQLKQLKQQVDSQMKQSQGIRSDIQSLKELILRMGVHESYVPRQGVDIGDAGTQSLRQHRPSRRLSISTPQREQSTF